MLAKEILKELIADKDYREKRFMLESAAGLGLISEEEKEELLNRKNGIESLMKLFEELEERGGELWD